MAFIRNRKDALLVIGEFSKLMVPPELCEQLIHAGEASNETQKKGSNSFYYICSARYISLYDLLDWRYNKEGMFEETLTKVEGSYEEFLGIICKKYGIESLNGEVCLNFKINKFSPDGRVDSENEFWAEPFATIQYKASSLLQEYYDLLKERKTQENYKNQSAYERLTDACKKMFDGEDD